MKIIVATKETQGQRDNDFCWADEEEFLTLRTGVCDKDIGHPDCPCGCNRCFTGITTRKGTTTAMVVATALSKNEIIQQMLQSHDKAFPGGHPPEFKRKLENDLRKIQKYEVGTILEYRNGKLGVRSNFDQLAALLSESR